MRAVLVTALAASGCLRAAAFECASDVQCTRTGAQGTCEAVGFCSFPDATCGSGRRFGEVSGTYTQQCVGEGGDGSDASIGGGVTVPDGLGCPIGYAILTGVPNRVYRRIATATTWDSQVTACRADGANVYLAIPDSATELQAILTLASSDAWVGVGDATTENSFVTVLEGAPAFLPWAAGQPDDSGGGSDCVTALSASATYDDRRCSADAIAVCECEP
jgi:Lectin C-type domain